MDDLHPPLNCILCNSKVTWGTTLDSWGLVFRLDTVSKLLSPGFRLGWVTGPKHFVKVWRGRRDLNKWMILDSKVGKDSPCWVHPGCLWSLVLHGIYLYHYLYLMSCSLTPHFFNSCFIICCCQAFEDLCYVSSQSGCSMSMVCLGKLLAHWKTEGLEADHSPEEWIPTRRDDIGGQVSFAQKIEGIEKNNQKTLKSVDRIQFSIFLVSFLSVSSVSGLGFWGFLNPRPR